MNRTSCHLQRIALAAAMAVISGCAATSSSTPPAVRLAPQVRPAPGVDPLDRITRPATLPASPAATRPTTRQAAAPLEALQLFAQARAAQDSRERFKAVQLLDQAIALDPDSYELHLALGRAALGTTLADRAMPAFQQAARIHPQSTEAWTYLARLYMQKGQWLPAIAHLRQAMLTEGYSSNREQALWVDYLMARSLQASDHLPESLQAYDRVLSRLPSANGLFRGPLEVMQIIDSPDLVLYEMAMINGKLARHLEALSAIEEAILEAPANQQYVLTRVRLLIQAGKLQQARDFMPEVISRFGSGVEIMSLLRELYGNVGGDQAAAAALHKAYGSRRGDRLLGFAVADLLQAQARLADAEQILLDLVRSGRYEPETVKHLYAFYDQQGRTAEAAQLLIQASALRPKQLSETAALMSQLTRLSRSNRLRLGDLQNLRVDSPYESARLYWMAHLARNWGRDELARSFLEKAVRQGRPYYPAYRELINLYWLRHDWTKQRKLAASNDLLVLAQMQEEGPLMAELRGVIALRQARMSDAANAFQEAIRLGDDDPEVQFAYATVQRAVGNPRDAEQSLLKLTEQYPAYPLGHLALIGFYQERHMLPAALRAVRRWYTVAPQDPSARMAEGTILLLRGESKQAERMHREVFDENADNPEILAKLAEFYEDAGQSSQFIDMLEQKREKRPDLMPVAEALVYRYVALGRNAEADRILTDLRRHAGNDPDLLYYVSSLYYGRLEDRTTSEQILEQVLQIAPEHSSAANDLGYCLAEQGRDLDRAEKLVRIAVREEPDNQAYLDSLGWVLYKKGQFDEARKYIEQAIRQTVNPDPIVLDHLGDALYQTGRTQDAVARWREASRTLERMGDLRGEYRKVKLQLDSKLRQAKANQPVQIATAEPRPTTSASATTAPATTRPSVPMPLTGSRPPVRPPDLPASQAVNPARR